MSLSDLHKYLSKNPVNVPARPQSRTLLVVSDSKGGYLQRLSLESSIESSIIYYSKGGRTSFQAANLIADNSDHFVSEYGNILIAVWTATCDFTQKSRANIAQRYSKYIALSNTTVNDVVNQFERILSVCRPYGDRVKVVFLECPYYSISIWNSNKGHENSDIFKESDEILKSKIESLNVHIRQLNQTNGLVAPKFSVDLIKRKKSNKVHSIETVSYSLLSDGIHSGIVLSRYWLRRIINTVLTKYCY